MMTKETQAVPHSTRLFRDEWAAKSRRPFRLDFSHSSNSGGVVVERAAEKAADWAQCAEGIPQGLNRLRRKADFLKGFPQGLKPSMVLLHLRPD